jgi:hypothetical protein
LALEALKLGFVGLLRTLKKPGEIKWVRGLIFLNMKGRLLRQDQRSVSDIYGTLLIISLAFVTSLLLVGGGWVVVDQIQSEAEDSLAQDNVENIDQGINELAGGSANETKTFQIPENTGENYEAAPDAGIFKINITTDEDYWSRTKAKQKNLTNGAGKEIVLGTIRHEAEDGTVTAFQGGGLWRQPPNSDTIFIESTPNLNFADGTLNLGIVNLTNAEAITEGSEITATRDGNTRSADSLKEFMEQFYTDRYNRAVTAPIQVNITIESEYADGWAKHAEERMGIPSSNVHQNFNGSDDMIRIEIPEIGDGMPDEDSPAFGDDDILYSGSSDWAYEYQNDSVAYGALEDSPPGSQWAYKPTLNESAFDGGDIDTGEYEFAVYNESGRWLIFNNTIPAWETADGTVVSNSNLGGSSNEVLNTTTKSNAVNTNGDHEFWINPPSELSQAGAAPICIVTNNSGDANVRQHLEDSDEGCLENMVGIDENLVDPIPRLADFNVTVNRNKAATQKDYTEGDEFPLEVTVENEGMGPGERPLGVYLINETNFKQQEYTKSFLANSTKAENLYLEADGQNSTRTINYDIPVKTQWRMAAGNDSWVVFATTGTDTSVLNESSDADDPDTFKVNPMESTFEIEKVGVSPKDAAQLKQGEKAAVEVTVNDTKQSRDEPETQIVRLERDGQLLNQTQVTIGTESEYGSADWEETVEMVWYIDEDAPTNVTLKTSTFDTSETTDETIKETEETNPEFKIDDTEVTDGVPAGETVLINATIKNEGDEAGSTTVLLKRDDNGKTVAFGKVGPLSKNGGDEEISLEWETRPSDYGAQPIDVLIIADEAEKPKTIELEESISKEPEFEIVSINKTNSPVTANGANTLDITVTVKNKGGSKDTQILYLDASGLPNGPEETGYMTVELGAGSSKPKTLSWTPTAQNSGAGDITVESEDDNESTKVTVKSPADVSPEFEVDFLDDPYEVDAGDAVKTKVNVTNVGNASGSQVISLFDIDGNRVAAQKVELDKGKDTQITLNWDTTILDVGEGNLTVESNNDEATAEVEVVGPQPTESDFVVSFTKDKYTQNAGETLKTTVNISNTEDTGSEVVYLEGPDGNLVDSQKLNLTGGESESIDLNWDTSLDDIGDYVDGLTVGSDNDNDTADAEVVDTNVDRSNFTVDIDSTATDDSVLEGNNLTVVAEVTNVGDVSDSQDIVLENFNGGPVDATNITLDASGGEDDSETVTLQWQTFNGTVPDNKEDLDGNVRVVSGDDDDEKEVTIEKREGTRKPVDVVFVLDETASMEDNDEDEERIEATETAIDAMDGSKDQAAAVGYDYNRGFCFLICPPQGYTDGYKWHSKLLPDLQDVKDSLSTDPEGNTNIAIGIKQAEQELTSDRAGSDHEKFMIVLSDGEDNRGDDPTTVAENVDDNITIYSVGFAEAGKSQMQGIANGGSTNGSYFPADNASQLVDIFDEIVGEIVEPDIPYYNVTNIDSSDSVTAGEPLEVDATVRNDGKDSGERVVTLKAPAQGKTDTVTVDTAEINIPPNEQRTVDLSWDTTGVTPNENVEISVQTPDDDRSTEVDVKKPNISTSNFTVDITGQPEDVDAGNPVEVEATITNGGVAPDNQTIAFYLAGDSLNGSEKVIGTKPTGSLSVDGSTELSFEWTPGADNGGTHTIIVKSEDNSETTNEFTIDTDGFGEEPFLIEGVQDDPTVEEGEKLTVNVTVENNGTKKSSQDVYLFDEDGDKYADVTTVENVASGHERTVSLTWQSQFGQDGERDFRIETNEDNETVTVDITERSVSESDFNVSLAGGQDKDVTVSPGGTAEITVDVKNEGGTGTEVITLNDISNGNAEDIKKVTLGEEQGNNTDTVTLRWVTNSDDVGDIRSFEAQSENDDTDLVNVTVEGQTKSSQFDVEIVAAETGKIGDELTVTAAINNTDPDTDTQQIVLRDGEGTPLDLTDVERKYLQNETVDLTWEPETDKGYTLNVSSETDWDETTVKITDEIKDVETSVTDVDIIGTEHTAGDEISIEADIKTDKNVQATDELVWLEVTEGGENETVAETYKEATITASGATPVELNWNTSEQDIGDYDLDVKTNHDEDADNDLTLTPPKLFDVSVESVNTPITAGDKLEVEVAVENIGNAVRSPALELNYTESNFIADMTSIDSIDPGNVTTVTLTWNTLRGVGDDDAKQAIRVQLANYEISDQKEVQINEADSNLDRVSRPKQDDPLDIDLSEIEIGD